MAVYTEPLEIYRGEKKAWQFTVTGSGGSASPTDLTSASILFAVYSAAPAGSVSSVSGAVFTRIVGTGITITGAASGIFQLTVNKTNTCSLDVGAGGTDYSYGCEVMTTGETEPVVIAQGIFRILPDVVRGA